MQLRIVSDRYFLSGGEWFDLAVTKQNRSCDGRGMPHNKGPRESARDDTILEGDELNRDVIANSFPDSIAAPPEILQLCDWVEQNGYPISGYFELVEHEDATLQYWFGTDQAIGGLAQFGGGPDGSLYCVWRDPNGSFPIVHLGSEGVNNLVLASNPVDFLRLLAVGYGEIGFDDLSALPQITDDDDDTINPVFQQWVAETFQVTIPDTGAEITAAAQPRHSDLQAWIDERCG